MPTLNEKKVFDCMAFLDNGEVAEIVYESQYIQKGMFLNVIKSCSYKGVDITPVFGRHRSPSEYPHGISDAVENNAHYQWEQKDQLFATLGLSHLIK